MTEPTIEEVRAEIDDAIDRLWAEYVCMGKPEGWAGHGVIEGLKRARSMTGKPWEPWECDGHESWKRYAYLVGRTWVRRNA